jgi:glycerophosphoryl diester phosphodiesterase
LDCEPDLTGAILIAHTVPVSPGELARAAGAEVFCPDWHSVDEDLVCRAHADGLRVLPWTVNNPDAWRRLIDWGVDGICTDHPDRLLAFIERST